MSEAKFPKKETDNGGRVEFKESTGLWKEALKSMVAFANTKGGVVYFGIDDNGKVINNEPFNDSTQRKLQNHFKQAIDPEINYTIEIQENGNDKVLAIVVNESATKIHTLRKSTGTGFFKRVGTVDNECSQEQLFQAQLQYRGLSNTDWSEKFCEKAVLDDLDHSALVYFKKTVLRLYAENKYKLLKDADFEELLREFGLIEIENSVVRLTNTCYTTFR